MSDLNDMALVREYADRNSEPAFAELVRRHINLVYSVALRFTGNVTDAQDITQAVFIILALKAARLRPATLLTGWLYETTRFTALKYLRTKARQQAREQEAYMQSTLNDADPDGIWKQLAPLLEEAMSRLNEKERTLVALRFFENKSTAETATLLGIKEWAVRKRVARAVEKIRIFFTKRGITLTAVTLTAALSANALEAASPLLVKTTTAIAVTKGATASISTLTLIKETLKLMTWTKIKTAIPLLLLSTVLAGTVTVALSDGKTINPKPVGQVPNTNDLYVGISSSFMVAPDGAIEKLGLTWSPAKFGGMVSILDKSETNAILQTLKQTPALQFLAGPRLATRSGVLAEITLMKPVAEPGTNTKTGVILAVMPTWSPGSSTIELSLTNELHEWVKVSGQPAARITVASASATLKTGQTIVFRQAVAEGQMLDKTIRQSSSALSFVSPVIFKAGTGLHRLK